MVINKQSNDRIVWLDWMKAWAILAIIWGHFFSKGHVYLYVFSVQVFCVISGFLYKRASDWTVFTKKAFWQLFVPTVIMSFIMQLEAYIRCLALGEEYPMSWLWFFEWLLLGHRWCMGPCWYFYSLIVMRLIMQLLPEKKWIYAFLFVLFSAAAILWHQMCIEISNANINVLVTMPFFLIGVFLKPLRERASRLHNKVMETFLFGMALLLVFLCGNYNGLVWMYLCEYGKSYILYIIGGTAGTLLLFIVSLWLSRLHNHNLVLLLSKGSILIIGLHIIIVRRLIDLPNRIWLEDLLFAAFILLAFVPIISIAERYFPLILGKCK